jgi:GH43 family beta-xylosidase
VSAPVHDSYFADPFVLQLGDGSYVAYGTGRPPADGESVFEALVSTDLVTWQPRGPVMRRLAESFGDEYWAPEVVEADGSWWLYYSVGRGISGHHIRVARSRSPLGPFVDQGLNLTPRERFAIDAHPFQDADGSWYLYFARDVVDDPRPGTQLAVMPLASMTRAAAQATTVLAPNADWQLFERQRSMYGERYDWHTLEGPSVVRRHDLYWLTYSGGAWTGDGYAVSWAVADSPLGPWAHAHESTPPLLATGTHGLIGPGHNSLVTSPAGRDAIAFHAWDAEHDARRMHVHHISFEPEGPWVDGPIQGPSTSRGSRESTLG